ncbi:Lrp/AsnC family transcriptional regulator [Allosalinactinospora lopnorensis]|uniref:Lrp/AsnC family transcriptional regulator n=1 Tax=Allosalinactinospora lopnorensis TaxID=1352348 RepID=UPI000696AC78|nr:Lrp/AsnC family transcriptional regulator [Allosalinactinospora lopnorensis]
MELDDTDAAIVRELQADGRLPFESLARRIGLSRAAARLRVRRLLDSGIIRVVGVPHPAVRGVGVLAQVALGVDEGTAPVGAALADLSSVTSVAVTTGRLPLVAELRERDLAGLTATVDRIRNLPGVAEVDTLLYTRVLKDPYFASSEPLQIDPDETDLVLLGMLERDGRLSFAEMAGHVGLSAGAVRSRVRRLLHKHAVQVTALLNPGALGLARHGGFTLLLAEDSDAAKEITTWEETLFLTGCLGRADLTGAVAAESVPALHALFERLRALPGVRVTDTWLHLERVEERYDR